MNKEQIKHQAQTILELNRTLTAIDVAKALTIALIMHLRKCSNNGSQLISNYEMVEGSMRILVEQIATSMDFGDTVGEA